MQLVLICVEYFEKDRFNPRMKQNCEVERSNAYSEFSLRRVLLASHHLEYYRLKLT